jgi:hypothetical protein
MKMYSILTNETVEPLTCFSRKVDILLISRYVTHFPITNNMVFFVVYLEKDIKGGWLGVDYRVHYSGLSSRFSSIIRSANRIQSNPLNINPQYYIFSIRSANPILYLQYPLNPTPTLYLETPPKKIEQLFIRMNPTTDSNHQLLLKVIL